MANLRTSKNYVEFIKFLSKAIILCRRKLRISKTKLEQRCCNYINNISLLVDETIQTHTLERLLNVKRRIVTKYARWLHDSTINAYMAEADTDDSSDESDDDESESETSYSDEDESDSDISIITISDSSESEASIITITDSDSDIDDFSGMYLNALTDQKLIKNVFSIKSML